MLNCASLQVTYVKCHSNHFLGNSLNKTKHDDAKYIFFLWVFTVFVYCQKRALMGRAGHKYANLNASERND